MYLSHIPLNQPNISSEEEYAIIDVLRSGYISAGSQNEVLEYDFAKSLNVRNAISVNSSTTAMQIILMAHEIKGEVIVPSFIYSGMVNAVVNSGCKPVYADINIDDQLINVSTIEGLINNKTEAIIVSHYAGQPVDMKPVLELCKKYKLLLIEDVGLSFGATYDNKLIGSFGIGCFSLLSTKGCPIGEGGMITLEDMDVASKIRNMISNGLIKGLYHWNKQAIVPGYDVKLNNLTATVAAMQFNKYNTMIDFRNWIASVYNESLNDFVITPKKYNNRTHSYTMYPILVPSKRDDIVISLNRMNIGASVFFDPPCHKQHAHRKKNILPYTQWVSNHLICLPIYAHMKKTDVNRVINSVREVMEFFRFDQESV